MLKTVVLNIFSHDTLMDRVQKHNIFETEIFLYSVKVLTVKFKLI